MPWKMKVIFRNDPCQIPPCKHHFWCVLQINLVWNWRSTFEGMQTSAWFGPAAFQRRRKKSLQFPKKVLSKTGRNGTCPLPRKMPIFQIPFFTWYNKTQPIGNWNQLMLFQALVAHNNLCEPWKLPCLIINLSTNQICKVLPEFCNPSSTLPPGNSTCSRQTSALKRRWLASSSSFGCAGSTSKASWRSQIASGNDGETHGPLWKTTKQN